VMIELGCSWRLSTETIFWCALRCPIYTTYCHAKDPYVAWSRTLSKVVNIEPNHCKMTVTLHVVL